MAEEERRQRRKDAYHLAAGKNKLPSDPDESDYLLDFLTQPPRSLEKKNPTKIQQFKTELVHELAISGGSVTSPRFGQALQQLTEIHPPDFDARKRNGKFLSGMWLTLNKPIYRDCLGKNADTNYLYTLGRMSFDMFAPTSLIFSIQGTFSPIHYVSRRDRKAIDRVPKSLKEEMKEGKTILRTYDIVTACTIESEEILKSVEGNHYPNRVVPRPIQALLTTNGYALPDPSKSNQLSIWFTGGSLEIVNKDDLHIWKVLFNDTQTQRPLREKAKLFGSKLAVGATPAKTMEADGKLSYTLNRPIGGHGVAHVDVLYLDETLRVVRTSGDEVNVFARVPSFPDE